MTRVSTAPFALEVDPTEVTDRLGGIRIAPGRETLEQIAAIGVEVRTDDESCIMAARDWWPLAIGWATRGQVAARPGAVVRPTSTAQVAGVMRACVGAKVPVTPMGGLSGVCGGAVPVMGGIALDLTGLVGPVHVDETSLLADVPAGTIGSDLESALRHAGTGYTLGHWPQSLDLSTVGGWLACRSAGQYSTRYGKIEDMVVGLEVVLADGTVVQTEGTGPRAATGPSLTQLFVGSEGTLGVITSARLRLHPAPPARGSRAFAFSTFDLGLDACRRVLRRGATPAVVRLYDLIESERVFGFHGGCVMIVLDEADPGLLDATLSVVDQECLDRPGTPGATPLDAALVEQWLARRNDATALAPLWRTGTVVDTAEVAGRWAVLPDLAAAVVGEVARLRGTVVASVHQSHAYLDGACLYFTFAGRPADGEPDPEWAEDYYRRAWDTLVDRVERHGAAISHHHGIGINRSRFVRRALGNGHDVLQALKSALDPEGILNPTKLGLTSPFGPVPWP